MFYHAGLAELGAEIKAHNRALVEAQTFGHLAPKRQEKYYGSMIFCSSDYGKQFIVKNSFETLKDNPWSFGDFNDWFDEWLAKNGNPTGIFRFEGYYQMHKNGNFRMSGTMTEIPLP